METGPASPEPRRKKGSTQEEHVERFRDFSWGRKGNTGVELRVRNMEKGQEGTEATEGLAVLRGQVSCSS